MRRNAEEFENALHNLIHGKPAEGPHAGLVRTALRVKGLPDAPPPPRGLRPGRQRFLAEAARLREMKAVQPRRPALAWRLAAVMAALLLLLGALAGAERASASSLPGDLLYDAKVAAERVRLAFAFGPESKSALAEAMAEERMGEILALLEQKRAVDESVSSAAVQQLRQALEAAARLEDTAAPLALQKLAEAIRQQEEAIRRVGGESPAPAVEALLREMERVREEAHLGQGDPDGLRERLRQGVPAGPTEPPGATPTPGRSTTVTPSKRSPSITPGHSATPNRTPMRTASPEPSGAPHRTPASSATPNRTGMPTASPEPSGSPHGTPAGSATPHSTGGPPASQTPGSTITPEPPRGSGTPGPGGTGTPPQDPGGTPAQTPGPGGGGNGP